jgi:hypothetical protein
VVLPNGKQPLKLPLPVVPNPEAEPRSDQEPPRSEPVPAPTAQAPAAEQPRKIESKINPTGDGRGAR